LKPREKVGKPVTQNVISFDLEDYQEITRKYQMWMMGNLNAKNPRILSKTWRWIGIKQSFAKFTSKNQHKASPVVSGDRSGCFWLRTYINLWGNNAIVFEELPMEKSSRLSLPCMLQYTDTTDWSTSSGTMAELDIN
jgi:hypothetical protein